MQQQGVGGSAGAPARESGNLTDSIGSAASDVYAKTAELTGEAAERARQMAAEAASATSSQVKELLDRQVGVGASMIDDVARSVGRAADDLDRTTPLLGELARGLASRMSGYADNLQGQSADDLWRTAADFTRRQPALMFGLAALAGFFAFRTFKSAPAAVTAPPIQPSQSGFSDMSNAHGSANSGRSQASGMSNGI